jgi:RNA polymerase sigma-70 factor (ECF subfamily)
MAGISDEELMVMFQNGNAHAFEILFEKYRIPVYNFIHRMLGRDTASAEDLLQEIFIKIVRAKDLYEPRGRFSTWLFSITRNHCLNFLRSRRYLEAKSSVPLDDRDATGPAVDASGIEVHELLEGAIDGLPDRYREVFLLHAVEGFTHREVSEILGMNAATVRTNYRRARAELRERLGDVLDGREE